MLHRAVAVGASPGAPQRESGLAQEPMSAILAGEETHSLPYRAEPPGENQDL